MPTHYSEKKDLLPLTGGCPCGLIRYQVSLPPIIVHCCYCTACQRQTGSVLAVNAVIESTALTLLPSAAPTIAGSSSNPDAVPAGVSPIFARTTSAEPVASETGSAAGTVTVCLPSQSGLGQTVASCPACHTGLWTFYAGSGLLLTYFRAGTLDRPWEIQPDVHIYTSSRQSWITVDDGKPSFEGYYPSREALLRQDALRRYEELTPKLKEMRAEMKRALS
ncbi:glutathione-dependent formaldehyde-activating [Fusarium albosuccineum]|uniref:Glutathione-dependent formaldehyde-activating n=1 Tax=Fusarium albosuccineum TaxID=1237068 RepID=A0A8H4L8K7_9HYPO|nr:glutathione-dependent formaldehyde-activating [Fusarium albosuccineum]